MGPRNESGDRWPPRRPPYTFGSEFSGLSRPIEWIGFVLTVIVILALVALAGWIFFGAALG